jgi:hypothetical protein
MKKLTTAILLTAAALGSVSCKKDLVGEGPVTTQTRTVPAFTGIDLRMNGTVYYTKDAVTKVEITAKQSIHSMLETNVVNNQLVIRYYNGKTYDADESIRINISAPDLGSFLQNTSGSIYSTNDINVPNLYIRNSGSGNIYLQGVTTSNIDAESTQSGHVTITHGTTQSEKLKSDASGKIDFSGVAAKTVTARTIGSGDIKVKVSDYLNATIDGSGSIYFFGYPSLSSHISGSGQLVRM